MAEFGCCFGCGMALAGDLAVVVVGGIGMMRGFEALTVTAGTIVALLLLLGTAMALSRPTAATAAAPISAPIMAATERLVEELEADA